jgi:hypothetical protein
MLESKQGVNVARIKQLKGLDDGPLGCATGKHLRWLIGSPGVSLPGALVNRR